MIVETKKNEQAEEENEEKKADAENTGAAADSPAPEQ